MDEALTPKKYLLELLRWDESDDPDWDEIVRYLESNKELVRVPIDDFVGMYVLHYAFTKHAPTEWIMKLMKEYPPAIKCRTRHGRYPLHYACDHGLPFAVIRELITQSPAAIRQKTGSGHYPLHYVCQPSCCEIQQLEDVIKFIYDRHPEAIREKTNEGCYPLHMACEVRKQQAIIVDY